MLQSCCQVQALALFDRRLLCFARSACLDKLVELPDLALTLEGYSQELLEAHPQSVHQQEQVAEDSLSLRSDRCSL